MKFKVELEQALREKLAGKLTSMTNRSAEMAKSAVQDLAEETYAKAKEMAFARLNTTAQDYVDHLTFQEVEPGVFAITLLADRAFLDQGYNSFDLKPGLLKKGKTSKRTGYKYRVIPMDQPQTSRSRPEAVGLKSAASKGSMAADLRMLKKVFNDKGTTTRADGKPLVGKALSYQRDPLGRWNLVPGPYANVSPQSVRFTGARQPSQNLAGVTKYQYAEKLRSGGTRIRTAYVTFRTVTDAPAGAKKWLHPGFGGARIFKDLEQWAQEQLRRKLQDIFG